MTSQITQETVASTVVGAVATQLRTTPDQVDLDSPMLALQGMESIMLLRAVAEIEDALDVIIADDALAEVVTTRDLITYVTKIGRAHV